MHGKVHHDCPYGNWLVNELNGTNPPLTKAEQFKWRHLEDYTRHLKAFCDHWESDTDKYYTGKRKVYPVMADKHINELS